MDLSHTYGSVNFLASVCKVTTCGSGNKTDGVLEISLSIAAPATNIDFKKLRSPVSEGPLLCGFSRIRARKKGRRDQDHFRNLLQLERRATESELRTS